MLIETYVPNFTEIIFVSTFAMVLLGHNLWLVARNEKDETIIEVNTSDNFPLSDSAVRPERVADFRLVSANHSTPITNYQVKGDSLIAAIKQTENACFAALELFPHSISLEPEKFVGYIRSENAEKLVAPQFVGGETTKVQRESYTKYAKVLLDSPGKTSSGEITFSAGHRFEIILQNNPATLQSGEKLSVKVLFEGNPISGLRVSVGGEKLNDGKYSAHAHTDENGLAAIEVFGTGLWFVRTHFIRPHEDYAKFDWESFWASTTFQV